MNAGTSTGALDALQPGLGACQPQDGAQAHPWGRDHEEGVGGDCWRADGVRQSAAAPLALKQPMCDSVSSVRASRRLDSGGKRVQFADACGVASYPVGDTL